MCWNQTGKKTMNVFVSNDMRNRNNKLLQTFIKKGRYYLELRLLLLWVHCGWIRYTQENLERDREK